jgi:hypothetical protein
MLISRPLLEKYVREIQSAYGANVVSIVLYGSGAGEEYHPKRSDLNFLIVLKDTSLPELKKARNVFLKWHKKHTAVPLVMDQEYIAASLDTFPIEFLNIQGQSQTLFGPDPVSGLQFDKKWVRLQAERELKGKLLRLQHVYLEVKKIDRELVHIIYDSLNTFAAIFRALLFLKDQDISLPKKDIILATCREFQLDAKVFTALWQVRNGEIKLKDRELEELFENYFGEIKKLSKTINNINL